MVRVIRQLLKPDWQPQRVCFEHPAPSDLSTHHRFFGSRVEFDCDFNGIVCAKADLDARNPLADPAMARYAHRLIDESSISPQATILEDVRRTILVLLPSGRCSIEQVSEYLGVVCRTVQRRLAEQGQSFSSIVNEIRTELATRHVMESDRPLTEVATMLGFSAPSGFSRWYHSQFGCSPKESRAARGVIRRGAAPVLAATA
jgi:AraC-like DNA-binding protein